jgi:hypothetical protein
MTTRTILLTLHIAAIASWLGADVVQHAMRHRWQKETPAALEAWARMQLWLHERYYAIVVLVIVVTGVGLVQDGHWGWSAKFVWVGIAAVAAGGTLGGIGLKGLAKRRIGALEANDARGAADVDRRAVPIELVLTAFVLVTVVAMVYK